MQRPTDRWLAISLSVLLHGALVAALAYGWWKYRRPPQATPLAIEATVVDARTVPGVTRPQPAPPPPPAPVTPPPEESVGPPPPTQEELVRREQEQKQAAERAAAAKAQAEQRRLEEQQAERAAEEKAAQARQAEERRKAEAHAAEEKARAVEEKRRQAQAQAQAQAEAQDRREREAELKRSLAAEERGATSSAATNAALASWKSQITAKITRAWLRPPTARAGLECNLYVTQVPGGEVTQVRVGECNGDQAVRESIEAAVYRASPLPPPPDPALFDRSLKITFKPDLD